MTDMTEQQEQEMIDRAKAGDPEANYQMSLWALEQAMAEPDEERWNRLAAKCLVKAAEAGYAPAKAKMDELLQAAEAKSAVSEAPPAKEDPRPAAKRPATKVSAPESSTSEQLSKVAEQAGVIAKKAGKVAGKAAVKAGKAIAAGTTTLAKKAKAGMVKASQARAAGGEGSSSGGSHSSKKASILPDFSQWDDAKWKKMQTICIIACVILALLIAILIISGNRRKHKAVPEEDTVQIPIAEVAATPVPTATPAPTPETTYPDQSTRDAIQAANLDVYPTESEYVTAPKTVTVNVSQSLNLRSGPGTDYTWVASMPSGAQLSVYANKNGWALVDYNGTWGWCSYDYLRS